MNPKPWAETLERWGKDANVRMSVFGEAEPVPEGIRVTPAGAPWALEEDSWLYIEGITLSGRCIVGLTKFNDLYTFDNIVWAPTGQGWGGENREPHRIWWKRIPRKNTWERLLADES